MLQTDNKHMKVTGEEALAFGALAAGVHQVTGYPGSPGIGTMNTIIDYARQSKKPYVRWAVNERIALEQAIGASMTGCRSLVITKSVGINVMLDPLMTLNLTGVHGGLVMLLGDDPGAYGSQNDQDSRLLALMLELPMLEPQTPAQAFDMIQDAYNLSERFQTAVIVRITRSFAQEIDSIKISINHPDREPLDIVRQAFRFVPYPNNAVELHRALHTRLDKIASWMEVSSYNTITGTGSFGIVTGGFLGEKLKNACGNQQCDTMRVLNLGSIFPLPRKLIRNFLDGCDRVLVLEESDAYLENQLKVIAQEAKSNVRFLGKESGHLPVGGELFRWQIQSVLEGIFPEIKFHRRYLKADEVQELPSRADHCQSSPNEEIFDLLEEVSDEIGVIPILIADPGCWVKIAGKLDGKFAIGSSVAVATGIAKSQVNERIVALIGDSGFFHSTLPAICDASTEDSNIFLLVLDNGGAVSTGFQPTPATGVNSYGELAPRLSIEKIARASGIQNTRTIQAGSDFSHLKSELRAGLKDNGLYLLIIEVNRKM